LLQIWQISRKTILFVTHSVREAVFLSRRVVVLSSRPGRVAEIVDIDLSVESRMATTVDLLEYERHIEHLIEHQISADHTAAATNALS
jgi:NitT/TauT family transport system ATP-binding protein